VSSPLEKIGIECPHCREVYEDWVRRSLDFSVGDIWSQTELEEATTSICPACGTRVKHEALASRDDGVWEIEAPETPG
jgi:DNA-directed RNA polymerase subunit RPC12/RpoP